MTQRAVEYKEWYLSLTSVAEGTIQVQQED